MRVQPRLLPKLFIVALLGVTLLAVACGGSSTTTSPTVAAPTTESPGGALATADTSTLPTAPAAPQQESGYPVVEGAYPSSGETVAEAYPAPAVDEAFLEPRFRIDQPVAPTATEITGSAPPNLTLAILDVTYNGAPLGLGQSDETGRFTIPVSGLIAGNRIGLAIGALPEGMDIAQTAEMYFPHRGEGFQNLPNVGVFYDTAQVQP